MKGLIIALILFVLLLGVIFLNFSFVNKSTDYMKEKVEMLFPFPCTENEALIQEIEDNWKKISKVLSLSISYGYIEELTDMIDATKAANETQNIEQYKIHVNLLFNAIEELGRLEKLSISNIL